MCLWCSSALTLRPEPSIVLMCLCSNNGIPQGPERFIWGRPSSKKQHVACTRGSGPSEDQDPLVPLASTAVNSKGCIMVRCCLVNCFVTHCAMVRTCVGKILSHDGQVWTTEWMKKEASLHGHAYRLACPMSAERCCTVRSAAAQVCGGWLTG